MFPVPDSILIQLIYQILDLTSQEESTYHISLTWAFTILHGRFFDLITAIQAITRLLESILWTQKNITAGKELLETQETARKQHMTVAKSLCMAETDLMTMIQ